MTKKAKSIRTGGKGGKWTASRRGASTLDGRKSPLTIGPIAYSVYRNKIGNVVYLGLVVFELQHARFDFGLACTKVVVPYLYQIHRSIL